MLDNAVTTQSRLILLDGFLLCFIFASVLCMLKLQNTTRGDGCDSFRSWRWWWWLVCCGFMLGAAISVKHTGLLVVAVVGLSTAVELWQLLGDTTVAMGNVFKHLTARFVFLGALPVGIYVSLFYVHFALLPNSGPGDLFMSDKFQTSLLPAKSRDWSRHADSSTTGSTTAYFGALVVAGAPEVLAAAASDVEAAAAVATQMERATTGMPLNVSYGSLVMIKQRYSEPCWLQSTEQRFPTYPRGKKNGLISSRQQVVACASRSRRNDSESWWVVVHAQHPQAEFTTPPTPVRHGDTIAFRHNSSGKMLNSHDVAAPMSGHLQEVSCYGVGDEVVPEGQHGHMVRYDSWQLTLLIQDYHQLQAGSTVFTLTHVKTDAMLQCSGVELPAWGGMHREVVAGFDKNDVSGGWTIDAHINHKLPRQPNARAHQQDTACSPSTSAGDADGGADAGQGGAAAAASTGHDLTFWERLVELHVTMIDANNGLTGMHSYAVSVRLDW